MGVIDVLCEVSIKGSCNLPGWKEGSVVKNP